MGGIPFFRYAITNTDNHVHVILDMDIPLKTSLIILTPSIFSFHIKIQNDQKLKDFRTFLRT